MSERVVSVTVDASGDVIVNASGRRLTASCTNGTSGLSSFELLQAALGSCMTASVAPLLARHGVDAGGLRVIVMGNDASLARGLSVGITLPAGSNALLVRCKRAVSQCPVLKSLNIPVDIRWQMNE